MQEKMDICGGFNEKNGNLEKAKKVLDKIFSKEELTRRLDLNEK